MDKRRRIWCKDVIGQLLQRANEARPDQRLRSSIGVLGDERYKTLKLGRNFVLAVFQHAIGER